MNKIDPDSKLPYYLQIKSHLLEDIRSGLLQPGEAIPPEAQLATMYNVARATVRQAISELVNEGYFLRHRGKGTFVNKPKIETKLGHVYSFAQDIEGRGLKTESQIIDFEVVLPKASVVKTLELGSGQQLVYKLTRLRFVDDEPILLETTFLPCSVFPDLTQEDIKNTKSLYSLLEETYKVKLDHVVDYFEPVLIDDYVSKLLDVPKGAPALYVERIGFLDNGNRAELSQSIIRGDRCRYFVELFRPQA